MNFGEEQAAPEKTERKYQVFISSTFEDLREQRRMVIDAVVDRGHMPIALERFAAADTAVPLVIQKTISACQIYIIILGQRYGSVEKDSGISFCQLEYELACSQNKIVVPFILTKDEVLKGRRAIVSQLQQNTLAAAQYKEEAFERGELDRRISSLRIEVANDAKLWQFRSLIEDNQFCQEFSLEMGGTTLASRASPFDGHMILKALLAAEDAAKAKRVSGWIKEPQAIELAKTVVAVSTNRFLVDVVASMAQFDTLNGRIKDSEKEKEAAAAFFADNYLQQLIANNVSLFFESGSSVAYTARVVGERLKEQPRELQISTNNVLVYLIFWLVHGIRCSPFPWGPPEKQYGAVFGLIDDYVPAARTPCFPPRPLSKVDKETIEKLNSHLFSPANWKKPALMLGAISGLQLTRLSTIANCLGPHVGSPRNKIFKRFIYATQHPLMLFIAANKIDGPVDLDRCHFVLEQGQEANLSWEAFLRDRPIAFCVGCENKPEMIGETMGRFLELGLKIIVDHHKSPHTAFVARNQRFIDEVESGMCLE